MSLVFLAEDNPGDVFLIREALREHAVDCELAVANDGAQAREYFTHVERDGARVPDLVLLDLNLPKISGMELLRRIKNIPSCRETPVVVISSSDSPRDRLESQSLGAHSYVRKASVLEEYMQLGGVIKEILAE